MGCSCNKGRAQYEVVADGGNGRVLYTSSSEPTAQAVGKRYAGSIVRQKGATATAAKKATATPAAKKDATAPTVVKKKTAPATTAPDTAPDPAE
ncbi:hypothetical protein [Streptomyces sp. NPDC057250]|uniref:hypothetical protein n=1 Tax=Streptomyces sp. NPDC057250 TaxID=3346068 RepID=UPI003630C6B0